MNIAATQPAAEAGFKSDYFAELMPLEEGNFWFRARNSLILWALKKYFPTLHDYMEIGCGTGFVLSGVAKAFPEASLHASDFFEEGLAFVAGRVPRATLLQMDARVIPFDAAFDVIGAFDVIEHITEDEAVLQQMAKALKPGGGIVLTVPQHPKLWSAADDYAFHKRRYTERELRSKVEQAGFEILRNTSFVSFLLPAMLLSRKSRPEGEAYDATAEFRIGRTLNLALLAIMTVERWLIQCGITFPIGGSRLIVARKRAL